MPDHDYVTPNEKFADIDKTFRDDINLCWLASACSMLWSSGWAGSPKWESPTDFFTEAKSYFRDDSCNAFSGALWYLCGSFPRLDVINNIYNSGGRYTSLSVEQASSLLYCVFPEEMYTFLNTRTLSASPMGAFTASVLFSYAQHLPQDTSSIIGGHEVPLWGFDLNKTIPTGIFDDLPAIPSGSNNRSLYGNRISAVQISDPDDEQHGLRFWLYAYYHSETHYYLLRANPADSTVPSGWKDGRSIWLNTMTYLVPKPTT